jgi:UDP-N-acetylglucosamine:LPS N-acetylglucosamine transferase
VERTENPSNTHRRLHICIGASAGGHLSQLLRLSESWKDHSVFCVSTLPIVESKLKHVGPVYLTGECNRHHPIRALGILLKAFRIVWAEKPDVVLTTGSMPLALLCSVAKLLGARIIWIDSVTNIRTLSVSGRWVRLFADLCLTQWPHVQKQYRNVEYVGAIV